MSFLRPDLTPKQRRFALISLTLGVILGAGSLVGFVNGYKLSQTDFMLVFAFHGVVDTPEQPWEIRYDKILSYLDGLRRYGFTPARPEEFDDWRAGRIPGGRRFLVTFDDGLSTSGKTMADLIKDRGVYSALFIVTDFVGTSGYLSWEDLGKLASAGCRISLHGKRHEEVPALLSRGDDFAGQTAEAIAIMQEKLGRHPVWFAYPFGVHDQTVRTLVASSSLQAAFTIEGIGASRSQDAYLLPRIMYLRGVEPTGEPGIDNLIPPEEIRQSSLVLTLSLLVAVWSIGLLYRGYRFSRLAPNIVAGGKPHEHSQ